MKFILIDHLNHNIFKNYLEKPDADETEMVMETTEQSCKVNGYRGEDVIYDLGNQDYINKIEFRLFNIVRLTDFLINYSLADRWRKTRGWLKLARLRNRL